MPYHPDRLSAIEAIKASKNQTYLLSELVDFQTKQIKTKSEAMPYVGLENVSSNEGLYIPSIEPKDTFSSSFKFAKGDILFAKLRPYLNKVYLAEFEGICSTEFHVLRCKDGISPGYLRAFLASDLILRQTSYLMTGNTLPRLQTDDIRSLVVPVPLDLSAQQQIAEHIQQIEDNSKQQKDALLSKKKNTYMEIENLIFG